MDRVPLATDVIYLEKQDAVWALFHDSTEPFAWFRVKSDAMIYCESVGIEVREIEGGGS